MNAYKYVYINAHTYIIIIMHIYHTENCIVSTTFNLNFQS